MAIGMMITSGGVGVNSTEISGNVIGEDLTINGVERTDDKE